jgi:hypothetical protein
MSAPDARLKTLVARQYGLDERAARLLVGDTLAELETSAASLAKLLQERREPEPVAGASDMFSGAAARKAQRQRVLVDALCGRVPRVGFANSSASSPRPPG